MLTLRLWMTICLFLFAGSDLKWFGCGDAVSNLRASTFVFLSPAEANEAGTQHVALSSHSTRGLRPPYAALISVCVAPSFQDSKLRQWNSPTLQQPLSDTTTHFPPAWCMPAVRDITLNLPRGGFQHRPKKSDAI